MPPIAALASYIDQASNLSLEERRFIKPLPPQIERATLIGRAAPGVLPGGKLSEFVQGMVVSVEVKASLHSGKSKNSNLHKLYESLCEAGL